MVSVSGYGFGANASDKLIIYGGAAVVGLYALKLFLDYNAAKSQANAVANLPTNINKEITKDVVGVIDWTKNLPPPNYTSGNTIFSFLNQFIKPPTLIGTKQIIMGLKS